MDVGLSSPPSRPTQFSWPISLPCCPHFILNLNFHSIQPTKPLGIPSQKWSAAQNGLLTEEEFHFSEKPQFVEESSTISLSFLLTTTPPLYACTLTPEAYMVDREVG